MEKSPLLLFIFIFWALLSSISNVAANKNDKECSAEATSTVGAKTVFKPLSIEAEKYEVPAAEENATPNNEQESSDTYIQADAIYDYPLIHSTNHYHRILRHKSKETGLYQQTLLFYAAVNTTEDDESFRNLVSQYSCSRYSRQVNDSDCQSMINTILSDYQQYCQSQNYTLQMTYSNSTIIDIGFQRRIHARNERLSLAKRRKQNDASPLTYRDVFAFNNVPTPASILSESRPFKQSDIMPGVGKTTENAIGGNEDMQTDESPNYGGDLAVLVTGYWELPVTKYHNSSHQPFSSPDLQTTKQNDTNTNAVQFNDSHVHQPNNNPYLEWFDRSLKINMPYVLFTDSESLTNLMLKRNNGFSTLFVSHEMDSFHVNDRDLIPDAWTVENKHVPSRALSKIWLEKIHLVYLASQIEKDALFYVWIDAGLPTYREVMPPSEEWSHEALLSLPKDRISYCRVEGEYHSFGAGVIVFPRSMVRIGHFLFYKMYEMCMAEVNDWKCGSDQYIWTHLQHAYPELFHAMSYDYGDIEFLWGSGAHRVVF